MLRKANADNANLSRTLATPLTEILSSNRHLDCETDLPSARDAYFRAKNLPIPSRTCTVLIPGFGVVSPAFEICMYCTARVHACSRRICMPNVALDVKFTLEVPDGTSCAEKSVPPLSSR